MDEQEPNLYCITEIAAWDREAIESVMKLDVANNFEFYECSYTPPGRLKRFWLRITGQSHKIPKNYFYEIYKKEHE